MGPGKWCIDVDASKTLTYRKSVILMFNPKKTGKERNKMRHTGNMLHIPSGPVDCLSPTLIWGKATWFFRATKEITW